MVVDFEIRSFRLSSSRVAPQTGGSQTARQSATRTGFSTTCHGALRKPIQLIENKLLTVRLRWPAVLLGHVLVALCPSLGEERVLENPRRPGGLPHCFLTISRGTRSSCQIGLIVFPNIKSFKRRWPWAPIIMRSGWISKA